MGRKAAVNVAAMWSKIREIILSVKDKKTNWMVSNKLF